jgi:hypothetical protein
LAGHRPCVPCSEQALLLLLLLLLLLQYQGWQ